MKLNLILSVFLISIASLATASAAQQVGQSSEDFWWDAAVKSTQHVEDEEVLSRALYELINVRFMSGNMQGASAEAQRITNLQLRCYSHISIAKFHLLRGDRDACLRELQLCRQAAAARGFTHELVDAYLDLADDPQLARDYVLSIDSARRSYPWQHLARALALRGHLDEALRVADRDATSDRNRVYADIAGAAATNAQVDDVLQVMPLIDDVQRKDSNWLGLVRALTARSRFDEATAFARKISDLTVRAEAESMISRGNHEVALVTIVDLRENIADTRDNVELYRLYKTLLDKQIAEKDAAGAEETINLIVAHVRSSKMEREVSAFGIVDDEARVAFAKAGYVQIALLLDRLGEKESSRAKLAIAEKALAAMPEAAGLGKLALASSLAQAQQMLGVKQTAVVTDSPFWKLGASQMVSRQIEAGNIEAAKATARLIFNDDSPGAKETVSQFVTAGLLDDAQELLIEIPDSWMGTDTCRDLGVAMIDSGHDDLLREWLVDVQAAQQAHLAIGALRAISHMTAAPVNDAQQKTVRFLTLDHADLPEGFQARQHVGVNPGVYPDGRLPSIGIRLQHNRGGSRVQLPAAARAIYTHPELGDIEVSCYTLTDDETAKSTFDEMYVRPFKAWYILKGRHLIYVGCVNRLDKAMAARSAIQAALEARSL